MEKRRFKSMEEFADALVSVIPVKEQRKFAMNVFDRRLSLRRQFIVWCRINFRIPKYSEETTKEIFSVMLDRKKAKRWKKFKFSVLMDVTDCWFDRMYGEESNKHKY